MAFHGNRGAPRGRGMTGGGRGTRGGMFRGRGRGRGASVRGGRGKPVFDSARLAEQKKRDAEASETESTDSSNHQDDSQSEDISSEDEDENNEEISSVRPYTALLQSLAVETRPPIKKQKMDNTPADLVRPSEDEEMIGTNDVDAVEETEEGPEIAVDGLLEEDEEEDENDPFEVHYANPDENVLLKRLVAIQRGQWSTTKTPLMKGTLPSSGNFIFSVPEDGKSAGRWVPQLTSSPSQLHLKQKLQNVALRQRSSFDHMEQLASCMFRYQDLFYCERTPANSENLRRLACLHAINHVFKTRDRVIKNNARLAKEENNDDLDLRDQGFTRPKILMLLPTRESCVRMVNMITTLCEPEQQENRKRFDETYVDKEEKFSADKAEDFRELFGGNDDDMFRLGIKFTRKTMKYFSQFYNSDIIIASPLGLRMAIGTEEDKKIDHDFLSSIEIVIVDQADSLLMQNWEHVEFVFEHLNLQPKEAHGCDFSRVRSWYLDNNAKYFRQTIALCAFNTPELNTLFYNHSRNWTGKIKIQAEYPGALQELGLKVKQTFSRLESPSFTTDPDTRFTYFTTTIIPSLIRHSKDIAGTILFVPSYLDFVRVRNYFVTSTTTSSISFGIISEYTSAQEVARARSHFLTGRHSVLLYTERAHHFRRYQIRGVKRVILYALPDNPIFYNEIVGGYLGRSTQEGKLEQGQGSVRVIFSKWDVIKLERIAGTERVRRMINEKGDTFDFV